MKPRSSAREALDRRSPLFTAKDFGGRGLDDAPRVDGAVSRGEVSGLRPFRTPSEHVGLDLFTLAEAMAAADWIWRVAEVVKAKMPSHRRGRPRKHGVADVALYWLIVNQLDSVAETHRFLQNPRHWRRLSEIAAEAWPDDLSRRLHDRAPTRYQFMYMRKHYMSDAFLMEQLAELNRSSAAEQAVATGLFAPELGKQYEPHRTQMAVSDGTWELAMTNAGPDPIVDQRTGREVVRRHDPDAYTYRDGSKPRGNMLVFLSAPGVSPRTGVILDFDYTSSNRQQDSDVAVEMALRAKKRVAGLRGLAHDKAATAKHREALMDNGVLLINALPRLKDGKVRSDILGEKNFTTAAGTTEKLVVWAIDGHPCIELHDGDRAVWVKLVRGKHLPRKRKRSNTCVLYVEWHLPDHPIVPRRLHNAKTTLRHNSNEAERHADKLVGRSLLVISPHDPCYENLYGTREFTESVNHHYKQKFVHQRARSLGLHNRRLDVLGYQAAFNLESLLMWHRRTGGDISPWFGRYRPA